MKRKRMNRRGLFAGPGAVRRDHPETSREAALSSKEGPRWVCFDAHWRFRDNGMNDFELANELLRLGVRTSPDEAKDTARKRRIDLKNLGLLYDSGIRRPSWDNRRSIVWCLTIDGEDLAMDFQ